ncbi:Germinal-center associated nuclear protein [Halocaridina rubra]|uniref:Germinal-center associated nuclear protein n=1 Tax=Halocaridina rubra TaxID=373956 RepID=A0AAN8XFK0_HALRR
MDKTTDNDPKKFRKPDLSCNPFSLSGMASSSAPVFTSPSATSRSCFGEMYGTMTSSTTTLARNLFSGSSSNVVSSSRNYPVSSIQANLFGGSAFKSINSTSYSFVSNPSVNFGSEGSSASFTGNSQPIVTTSSAGRLGIFASGPGTSGSVHRPSPSVHGVFSTNLSSTSIALPKTSSFASGFTPAFSPPCFKESNISGNVSITASGHTMKPFSIGSGQVFTKDSLNNSSGSSLFGGISGTGVAHDKSIMLKDSGTAIDPYLFGGSADSNSNSKVTSSSLFEQIPGPMATFEMMGNKSSSSQMDEPHASTFTGNLPFLGSNTSSETGNMFGSVDKSLKASTSAAIMPAIDSTVPTVFGGKTPDVFSRDPSTLSSPSTNLSVGKPLFDSEPANGSTLPGTDPSHLPRKDNTSSLGATVFGGISSNASKHSNLFPKDIFGGVQESSSGTVSRPVTVPEEKIVVSAVSLPKDINKVTTSHALASGTGSLFGGTSFAGQKVDYDDNQKVKYQEKLKLQNEKELLKESHSTGKPPTVFGGATETTPAHSLYAGEKHAAEKVLPSTAHDNISKVSENVPGNPFSKKHTSDLTQWGKHDKKNEKYRDKQNRKEKSSNSDDNIYEEKQKEKSKEKPLGDLLLDNKLFDIFGKESKPTSLSSNNAPEYDKKELTKIIIAQIPDSCMDKNIIQRHFETFGRVKRVYLNPKSNQATVQYEEHRGASRAKRKGHKIHPNLPAVKIFFATPARRKSEDGSAEAALSKKKAIKTLKQTQPTDADKSFNDLNPYTPLERPSSSSFYEAKCSRKDQISKGALPSQLPADIRNVSKALKPSSPFPVLKTATQTFKKESSPKAKLDSPKHAKLKAEEQKNSRGVSPAKEYAAVADITSLKGALEMQAWTSGDKYNVLKARDKLMRNEKRRTADINKATSLDATCPDMCPELERYMRDEQNDIHSYEMSNGIMDHRLVVKKFSRSSADKEEPLPHELRPGSVLLSTMDYLVCNVMALCDNDDTDTGVWYNYLWDRTRAIRGDITQQQLTSDTAVTIIERCVRFHIFADVRLCEESPDIFDRKLNTENLTKSLQTLKELYQDLAELGKYFPSECEFRAYEILLNLNDGETIVHQYLQYRDEVQKSPNVIYALKVFLALKSNNFVKFYKLIRSGTYLQGCILHRYFQQVRSKALDTYFKAYVVVKSLSFPLSYIIHTLGFEDETDATTYLSFHGIQVEAENVLLDKNSYNLHPEGQPPVTRPLKLIESNRCCSIVEVIQGGPIPENPVYTYRPHNSFDDQGYLKQEARDASDQWKKLQSQMSGMSRPFPSSVIHSSEPLYAPPLHAYKPETRPSNFESVGLSKKNLTEISDAIFVNITTSVIYSVSEEVVKESVNEIKKDQIEKLAIRSVGSDILAELMKVELQKIGKTAFLEIDQEEKERKRKEYEAADRKHRETEELLSVMTTSLSNDYIEEVLADMLREVIQDSVYETVKETLSQVLHSLSEELPLNILNEAIKEEAVIIGNEALCELTRELECKIVELQNKMRLRRLGDYFKKWRKAVLLARRRKQAQATFPACCSQLSIEEQNQKFAWGYHRKQSENINANDFCNIECEIFQMSEKRILRDRLLKAVAWYPLPIQHEIEKLVAPPSSSINRIQQYFKLVLCTSLTSDSATLRWLRAKLNGTGLEYGFTISEVSTKSVNPELLKGTSAVIFAGQETDFLQPGYLEVLKLLNSTLPHKKIICQGDAIDRDSWILSENELLLSETSEKLMKLVIDLWKAHADRIHIFSGNLNNFVSGFVAANFVKPAMLKQQERYADGRTPFMPSVYIELYNAAIKYLIDIIDDKEISLLDWPPPELNNLKQIPYPAWNKADAKSNVDKVKNLFLPAFNISGSLHWKAIVSSLYTYVGQVSQPGEFSIELWSHVYSILSNVAKVIESADSAHLEDPDVEVHVLQLPWTEIICACTSYKLHHLDSAYVFYQPMKLTCFTFPESWWKACDKSDPQLYQTLREGLILKWRKRKTEDCDRSHKDVKMPKFTSGLLHEIAVEREKMEAFQKKLEMALDDWNDVHDAEKGYKE